MGTAANRALLVTAFTGLLEEDFLCWSMDVQITMQDITTGEGPLRVGIAHGDYSIAEITEALDVTILSPDNKIEQERKRRLVRTIGKVSEAQPTHNDGKPYRLKVGWVTGDGEVMNMWTRNVGGGTMTTGAKIEAEGLLYGKWLR